MRRSILFLLAILMSPYLALAAGTDAAPSLRVRIPAVIRVGDATVPAATYDVVLADGAEGREIVLMNDGEAVARELCMRPVHQPTRARSAAWAQVDQRDERTVRVFVQHGKDLYLAVFQAAELATE